jgi:hypothetical protein
VISPAKVRALTDINQSKRPGKRQEEIRKERVKQAVGNFTAEGFEVEDFA